MKKNDASILWGGDSSDDEAPQTFAKEGDVIDLSQMIQSARAAIEKAANSGAKSKPVEARVPN